MFRGRGGGRPYPLRGVRPVQMKPGRGRSAGHPGYPAGRPRPLLEPGWGPRPPPPPPPPPMMRGMGPRPPPFGAPPMRGRGGPPVRGRGAPAGRGWSPSTRSRGASRGRGATRGRGASAKTQTTTKSPGNAGARPKGEKEKDELALSRPWVTDALKAEIQKKAELQAISLKSKSEKDFEAFKEQRAKVGNMLRVAKMEYIGMQDEQDVDKIMADARQKSKEVMAAESKAATAANGNGTSEAIPAATETTANGDDSGAAAAPADAAV